MTKTRKRKIFTVFLMEFLVLCTVVFSGCSLFGSEDEPEPDTPPGPNFSPCEDTGFGSDTINKMIYTGEKFVAISSGQKIGLSEDGVTWSAVPITGYTNIFLYITYGKNLYVASTGRYFASSDNGVQWTDSGVLDSCNGLIFGGEGNEGKFMAVANYGKISYSEDGINWTPVADTKKEEVPKMSNPFKVSDTILAVAYGGGRFVAASTASNKKKIAYSEDGLVWTEVKPSPEINFNDISNLKYCNGRFILTGSYGGMAYSEDGALTWECLNTDKSDSTQFDKSDICDVDYGDGKYIAVGYNTLNQSATRMSFSESGITWYSMKVPSLSGVILNIVYAAGKFVIAGTSGTMLYSLPDDIPAE